MSLCKKLIKSLERFLRYGVTDRQASVPSLRGSNQYSKENTAILKKI